MWERCTAPHETPQVKKKGDHVGRPIGITVFPWAERCFAALSMTQRGKSAAVPAHAPHFD